MKSVFINTSGKVGSALILENLVRGGFKRFEEDVLSFERFMTSPVDSVVHGHSLDFLLQAVSRWTSGSPYTTGSRVVVTGVREVLSASVSAFFQNIDNDKWDLWFFGPREHVLNAPIDNLIEFFESRVDTWLDEAVLPYPARFDSIVGCSSCRPSDFLGGKVRVVYTPGYEVLFYRLEDFPKSLYKLFRILGAEVLTQRFNAADQKWYSSVYAQFISRFNPSERLLTNTIYSEMMSMFYSEPELEKFWTKWRARRG
jgi:hypothetical protein